MAGTNGRKALHIATFSGWYRFEQDSKQFRQTKRDLTYWTLTCMSVDPDNPEKIYAGSEHSGLFYTENAGKAWKRAEPNTPKMMLFSALALNGGVMVGTIPSAVYRSKNGGWEELEGVRKNSAGANFPPSPELQSRARYLAYDPVAPARLYAGIEVGGMLVSDDSGYSWQPANRGSPTWTCTRSSPARPIQAWSMPLAVKRRFAVWIVPSIGKTIPPRRTTTARRSRRTKKASFISVPPKDGRTYGFAKKARSPRSFAAPTRARFLGKNH